MSEVELDFTTMPKQKVRKHKYRMRLERLLAEYKNILIINVDFVGSNQMQQVRGNLRGRAEVLMGKNTIIRKVLRTEAEKNTKLEGLLPFIKGNMGFVFTNEDLNAVRKDITANKVPAAAKAGVVAPADVVVPAGPTGLDPGQTQFFQALNIATKISRGAIEIITDVHLIRTGEKISPSATALLNKLNIKPFEYGIRVTTVYEDGSIYDAAVLDLTEEIMLSKFFFAVSRIAAIGLEIGYPCAATLPHSFGNAFKKLVAICLETDYMFEEAKIYAEMVANPGAFAAAAPAAGGAAAAAPVEEEEEEEEAVDMGGLFGDDDDEEAADY